MIGRLPRIGFWFAIGCLGFVLLLTADGLAVLAGGAATGVALAMMLDAIVEATGAYPDPPAADDHPSDPIGVAAAWTDPDDRAAPLFDGHTPTGRRPPRRDWITCPACRTMRPTADRACPRCHAPATDRQDTP